MRVGNSFTPAPPPSRGPPVISVRLERQANAFTFLPDDLQSLFSKFGPIAKVDCDDYNPAIASVTFAGEGGGAAASAAAAELDSTSMPHVGLLRVEPQETVQVVDPPPRTPEAIPVRPEKKEGGSRMVRFELMGVFGCEPQFSVTQAIVGPNEDNVMYLLKECNHSVELQIKGTPSNTLPVSERLHVALLGQEGPIFDGGVRMCEDLLRAVYAMFTQFCQQRGARLPSSMWLRKHEYHNGKYIGVEEVQLPN